MDIRRKKVIKSSVLQSAGRLLAEARKAHDAKQEDRALRYVRMVLDLLKKNKVKLPATRSRSHTTRRRPASACAAPAARQGGFRPDCCNWRIL
jgi:RNase P subunit RPR2